MSKKLVIAAAGSGKTTYLVERAFEIKGERVLITTFTDANADEIGRKFREIFGRVPSNITIQPWFSFGLQNGVKPFQSYLLEGRIRGIQLVESQSATIRRGNKVIQIPESNISGHYFDYRRRIYTDKISKFAVKCNELSKGLVIERLESLYPNIFIDEVQDFAGYDFDFVKLLLSSKINVIMVGDQRQKTYQTHPARKNAKFQDAGMKAFIEEKCKRIPCDIDTTTLTKSHRCKQEILDVADRLYPEFPATTSANAEPNTHEGVWLIPLSLLDEYSVLFCPVFLRYNITVPTPTGYRVLNFGEAKGLTFDRVAIFPVNDMRAWLKNPETPDLKPLIRAKFYVALTRARLSSAIIIPDNEIAEYPNHRIWSKDQC